MYIFLHCYELQYSCHAPPHCGVVPYIGLGSGQQRSKVRQLSLRPLGTGPVQDIGGQLLFVCGALKKNVE